MSLERWFRLLQYLTLGLSCAALVFAEEPFLPDLRIFLAPVLALLLLAWWVDERWTLPNWGANILGSLIAAGGVVWLVQQLSDDEFVLANLPLHLALLPYMGPLSIAVLLVKVFRERDAGHFWHLQGLGLMQIGLGCVLDGGPDFGAAAAVYLASALACLVLHYRLSTSTGASGAWRTGSVSCRVEGVPHPAAYAAGSPRATPRWVLSFTLSWTLLISVTALLLFLLTPRRDNGSWQPLNRLHSGYSHGRSQDESEEMNLNHTGLVELDDGVAFQVAADDASGQPKLDLPSDQRWRGSVLDWYDRGKWVTMHLTAARTPLRRQHQLPDFGPNQFILDFTVQPRQAGGLVLAEPIRFGPAPNRLPVLPLPTEGRRRLFAEHSGTVLQQVSNEWRHEYQYRQVVPALDDPSRIPAEGIQPNMEILHLLDLPPALREPLQSWTLDLLRRLSQHPNYNLPEVVRVALAKPDSAVPIHPAQWEAVARALTAYLAQSGEFSYSLELTRLNRAIDPVLDFLINVKRGHCERYAGALALMLRSVRIPVRVVKGFRGCDSQGNGRYVVRHSHAHAWVEILVPHVASPGEQVVPPIRSVYDWVTLDATPAEPASAGNSSSLTYLWDETHRFCLQWWRALIVEYNGDEQANLWDSLKSGHTLFAVLKKLGLVASPFVVALAAWLIVRRSQRQSSSRGDSTAGYSRSLFFPWRRREGDAAIYPRLVRILGRYASLRPSCGQTPREYGTSAHALLQARPTLATLADFPKRVVELFYRMRFGGQSLPEVERQEINAELDHFAQALQGGSAKPPRSPASRG